LQLAGSGEGKKTSSLVRRVFRWRIAFSKQRHKTARPHRKPLSDFTGRWSAAGNDEIRHPACAVSHAALAPSLPKGTNHPPGEVLCNPHFRVNFSPCSSKPTSQYPASLQLLIVRTKIRQFRQRGGRCAASHRGRTGATGCRSTRSAAAQDTTSVPRPAASRRFPIATKSTEFGIAPDCADP